MKLTPAHLIAIIGAGLAAVVGGIAALDPAPIIATLSTVGLASYTGLVAPTIALATAVVAAAHATKAAPASAKALIGMLLLSPALLMLHGCATFTTAQSSAITTLATAAVVADVEKTAATPADKTAKAVKIKAIATQLQAIDQSVLTSLPAVLQALSPLIAAANLDPAEVIVANELVAVLQQVLQAQLGPNPSAAQVQTNVQTVLTAVIAACAAYGA